MSLVDKECCYITSTPLSCPSQSALVNDVQSAGAFSWGTVRLFLLFYDNHWQSFLTSDYWICQPSGMRVIMMRFNDSAMPHASVDRLPCLRWLSHEQVTSHSHSYQGKSASGTGELKYRFTIQKGPCGALSGLLSEDFNFPMFLRTRLLFSKHCQNSQNNARNKPPQLLVAGLCH